MGELDAKSIDPTSAFHASLLGNLFSRMTLKPFANEAGHDLITLSGREKSPFWGSFYRLMEATPVDQLDELFPIRHLEYLQQAYASGKGVILLTYHSPVNRLAVAALARRFPRELIPTISEKRARRESRHWQDNKARDLPASELNALKAGIALEGQHLLAQGKMVQFVSDNEFDNQGYAVIMAKRRYYLRPGFAELALNTGALVVPQYNLMRPDGRILMTILPPFVLRYGNRETQIAMLLDQYAAFINQSWKAAPESIRWPRLIRHFNQPLAF
jgi:lauroyl/myristoyl acyltransferase